MLQVWTDLEKSKLLVSVASQSLPPLILNDFIETLARQLKVAPEQSSVFEALITVIQLEIQYNALAILKIVAPYNSNLKFWELIEAINAKPVYPHQNKDVIDFLALQNINKAS